MSEKCPLCGSVVAVKSVEEHMNGVSVELACSKQSCKFNPVVFLEINTNSYGFFEVSNVDRSNYSY